MYTKILEMRFRRISTANSEISTSTFWSHNYSGIDAANVREITLSYGKKT